MASEKLIIGYAGNLPYYAPSVYLADKGKSIKDWVWTYRNREINNPIYKSGYFFYKGLQQYINEHGKNSVEVWLWGNIQPGNQEILNELGLDDVCKIEGFIPKQQSVLKLQQCDVLLMTLAGGVGSNKPFSFPGKLFDYFKIGKPILAVLQESSCAQIIRDSGLGVICDPDDTTAIANRISWLVENKMRLEEQFKPNVQYLSENFSMDKKTQELAMVFDRVLGKSQ